jgi:hypothetical protein
MGAPSGIDEVLIRLFFPTKPDDFPTVVDG